MRVARTSTGFLGRVFGPLLALCVLAYFGYFTLAGERSIFELSALRGQVADSSARLERLQQTRGDLEQKVRNMRPGSIDRDTLEAQARKRLGYVYEGEKVILPESAWQLPGRRPLTQ